MQSPQTVSELVKLSHEFGERGLVILGEGNTSARNSDHSFLVKASGSSLRRLTEQQLTECHFEGLLAALDAGSVPDDEVERILLAARVDPNALKPSVETFFHAYLLTLPGINFVGHAHPIAVNQILASPLSRIFAENRQCPDEIVCCGAMSALLPYIDPGLILAVRVREEVQNFEKKNGKLPRVILLENHGVIAIGGSADAVRAAMYMTVKAAEVFIGAFQFGNIRHLTQTEIERIEGRVDEEYRRKMLKI
jgi:rhamnose utilization protein RhaD (predicted bifunctional aldolase and dehydrogenase)